MPTIDPDAPWWANLGVLVIVLAVVPAVTTWVTGRNARKRATDTQADVAVIREEVKNTHSSNLRGDLDKLRDAIDGVRDDLGGLHSEVRDTRRDIGGIRTDARQDRRILAEQREALDTHLTGVPSLVTSAISEAVRQAQTTTTTSTTTSTTPAATT
jgi:hypothetical protein